MFSKPRDVLLVLIQSNLPPTHEPSAFITKKQAIAPASPFERPHEASVGPVQRYDMELFEVLRPPMDADVLLAPEPFTPPNVQRREPNGTWSAAPPSVAAVPDDEEDDDDEEGDDDEDDDGFEPEDDVVLD